MNGDTFCLLPCGRAAYGLIERPNDFASYLLAIAICNLLLYFAFYIIMKVCVCAYIYCSHTGFRVQLGSQSVYSVFSCGVVRGFSVWHWCASSSPPWCGALPSISSSRVSARGKSVTQKCARTHTHTIT